MGTCVQSQAPAALTPGERHDTHCTVGWVAPRPVWSGAENSPPPRFDPRTVHPVASRYIDCAIPAQPRVTTLREAFASSGVT